MSDDELYRRYMDGDQSSGDELMLRYADMLTSYLDAFVHNPEDAEDLMLDCFTVILVKKPQIAEGHFKAYLFKVARNKAGRLWKYRLKHQEFELDDTLPSPDDAPETTAWSGERAAILDRCLNRIAPQYREALWLFYFMGFRYAEAAGVMNCSVKRVEDLLRNGKKRLRLELEKEGFTNADI